MSAHVYFVAASNGQGDALWETDGTIAGTVQVGGSLNVGVADANTNGLDPNYWTVLGDDLLFGGVDNYGTGIDALWVSDGSASGTYEIGGVANQAVADAFLAFYVPRFFTGFGDKALFVGANAADHYDLWVKTARRREPWKSAAPTMQASRTNMHWAGLPATMSQPEVTSSSTRPTLTTTRVCG